MAVLVDGSYVLGGNVATAVEMAKKAALAQFAIGVRDGE